MTQSGHFQMREKSGDQGCHAKFAPRLLENEPCSLQSTFDPKQTCAGGLSLRLTFLVRGYGSLEGAMEQTIKPQEFRDVEVSRPLACL